MRPILRPGLRLLRRNSATLQIGVEPDPIVLIDDCATSSAVFAAMDGVRRDDDVIAHAVAAGAEPQAAREVVEALTGCGVLEDADVLAAAVNAMPKSGHPRFARDLAALSLLSAHGPSTLQELWRRRRAATVEVRGLTGPGRIAARCLALAGIGGLVVDERTARDELAALAPWTCVRSGPSTTAVDAVLLVPAAEQGIYEPDRSVSDALLRAGVPHLVTVVRGNTGQLGPFVGPGTSPCLRCVDLARTAADPGWPALLDQLATAGRSPAARPPAADPALATMVGAWAALEILAFVQGFLPTTSAATLTVTLPDLVPQRRSWRLHPACGCGWQLAATMGA